MKPRCVLVVLFDVLLISLVVTALIAAENAPRHQTQVSAEKGELPSDVLSRLIPRPQQIRVEKGEFSWGSPITVIVGSDCADDQFAAETLIAACQDRGLAIPAIRAVAEKDSLPADGSRFIVAGDPSRFRPVARALRAAKLTIPREAGEDGYLLDVAADRIILAGNSSAGVYYAVQTLIQLLPESREKGIRAVRVTDGPALRVRGMQLDFAMDEVQSVANLKETIRRMAHYKMNLLVLNLEDAFLFPSHPDIGETRDRITTEEAREVCDYARRHHVEVAPFYNSPGHMNNTLAHPHYRHLRESDTPIFGATGILNLSHPDAAPLLEALYTDLCKAFSGHYFYMSGDEAFGLGMGANKALCDEIGTDNVIIGHTKRIRDIVARYGKRLVIAGDPFEPGFVKFLPTYGCGLDGLSRLPRDIIITPWHYGQVTEYPFGRQLAEMGFEQILWSSNAAYDTLYPYHVNAAANVTSYIRFAHTLHALGAVHSDWDVPGADVLFEFEWPAMAFFGEWTWSSAGRSWNEALPVALRTFYGPGTEGLAKTIAYLSTQSNYFGWARVGWTPPERTLFFAPLEPRELGSFPQSAKGKRGAARKGVGVATAQKLLDDFRASGVEADSAFQTARKAATRHRDHLDYVAFALDQARILADLVQCRHFLSQADPAARQRQIESLESLHKRFPAFASRFGELWQRGVGRPLGLRANMAAFDAVANSIAKRRQELQPTRSSQPSAAPSAQR